MAVLFPAQSRCHICNAGYPQGFDAHVVCRNGLRHGGHSYGVAAHCSEHPYLRRRFIAGSLEKCIYAVLCFDPEIPCGFLCGFSQFPAVRLRHIGKSFPEPFVVCPY